MSRRGAVETTTGVAMSMSTSVVDETLDENIEGYWK